MKINNAFVKAFLIIGLILTVFGGLIFSVAMTANGWNFGVLSSHVVEKRVIEITDTAEIDAISSVKIELATADVNIVHHDEDKIIIECYDLVTRKGNVVRKATANVINGELFIKLERMKNVVLEFGSLGNEQVTVKLPKDKVVGFNVKVSTGDIFVGETGKACAFTNLSFNTSTGDVTFLGNVDANQVTINNDTGDVFINGKLNVDTFKRTASTGDVNVNATVKAEQFNVKNSTGDVNCSAYIDVKTINITTSTGDVTIKLVGPKTDYNYSYEISTGESNISAFANAGATKTITITCSTGDANVYFG